MSLPRPTDLLERGDAFDVRAVWPKIHADHGQFARSEPEPAPTPTTEVRFARATRAIPVPPKYEINALPKPQTFAVYYSDCGSACCANCGRPV